MSKKSKQQLLLAGLLIVLSSASSHAQDGFSVVTRDFELWSKAGLKYDFNKKWTFSLDQGLRFRQDASITDQVFTNVGLSVNPIKPLKFAMDLRYIYDRGGNLEFDNDFRINFDASYKQKFDRFSLTYRLRYQNRNEIGFSKTEGDVSKNYLRFRTKFKYNIPNWKFDPYVSGEIFRDLTRYTGNFDLIRFTAGTSYNFKKFGELGAFYRFEHEIGSNYPKTTHIVGLRYTINLKRK